MNVKLFIIPLLLLLAGRSFGTTVPIINIPSAIGAPNETVCVDVQVANFTNISAMELELKWGNQGFDYQGVTNITLPGLYPSQFDFSASTGLYVYWENTIGADGLTLPDGTSIFQICIQFKNDCNTVMEPNVLNFLTADDPIAPITGQLKGAKLFNSSCYTNAISNFKLATSEEIGTPGDTICVGLSAKNFTNINALTYSLQYDPQQLQFVGLTNLGLPGLSVENFVLPTENSTNAGTITMNWASPLFDGQIFPDNLPYANACFKILGQPGNHSTIYYSNEPQPIQATNADTGDLYYDLLVGGVNIISDPLEIIQQNVIDATCANVKNGQIYMDVTGGVAPYIFQWTGPNDFTATTKDLENLEAGEYKVTITDSQENVIIGGPFLVNAQTNPITLTQSDVKICPSMGIQLSAATPNLAAYFWTSTQGKVQFECGECSETYASSADNLEPGIYQDTIVVTAVAQSGCVDTAILPITVSVFDFSLAEAFEVCAGDSLEIKPTTAFDPDGTYNWYGDNDFTASQYALQAADFTVNQSGMYAVTYTNKEGCALMGVTNIRFNAIPELAAQTVTDKVCADAQTGAITLEFNPANAPYTVYWSTNDLVNAETSTTLSNLGAGDYQATYKDSKGCGKTLDFHIGNYAPLEAFIIKTDACGNADDGNLKVNITNGDGPFNITWSNQETTDEITNLIPGNYAVTVEGAGNCTTILETIVNRTEIIGVSQDTTIDTGIPVALEVEATNAATIQWSPETGLSDPTAAATAAAPTETTTYVVTVTDGQLCVLQDSVVVTVKPVTPPLFISAIQISDATCTNIANGTVDLTVKDGEAPYTYQWTGPDGFTATTEDLYNILPGEYNITITDNIGNAAIADGILVGVTAVPAKIIASDTKLCPGGSILLQANDVPSLVTNENEITYSWSSTQGKVYFTCTECPNPIIQIPENLEPGVYVDTIRVVISESNQCERTGEVVITVSVFDFNVQDVYTTCIGEPLTIAPENGVDPSGTYQWQGPNNFVLNEAFLKTDHFTPLESGIYTLAYTNEAGCTAEASTTLTVNVGPEIINSIVTPACGESTNGSIQLWFDPVNAPYIVSWNSNQVVVLDSLFVLPALEVGTYNFIITNQTNCGILDTTFVVPTSPIIEASVAIVNACGAEDTGEAEVTVTAGEAPYSFTWSNGASIAKISNLTPGAYIVTVSDANSCSKVLEAVVGGTVITSITEDTVLEAGTSLTLELEATGTPSILWSPEAGVAEPDQFVTLASPLTSTTFVATLSDGKNCEIKDSVFVLVLPKGYATGNLTPVRMDSTLHWCNTLADGYGIASIEPADEEQSVNINFTAGDDCFSYTGVSVGIDTFLITLCNPTGSPCFTMNTMIEVYDTLVWPGDTDNNGIVNNRDILNIGIANTAQVPKRSVSSTAWQAQYAPMWSDFTPSTQTNYTHIDVDGNGIINLDDTLGVVRNWGLLHVDDFQEPIQITPRDPGTPLFVAIDTVQMGSTVRLPIILGMDFNPALDAYGTAFTIQYDTAAIDPSSVSIEFVDSWLGQYKTDYIGLYKNFEQAGKIETAITRFNQQNVDGAGIIAYLNIKVKEVVADPTALFSIEAPVLIDATQIQLPIAPVNTEIKITTGTYEPWLDSKITLFPNPAKEVVTIRANDVKVEHVILYNVNGQVMLQSNDASSFAVDTLKAGMYFCKIQTDKGLITKRIVVVK